jgi:hypothetical protein
MSGKDRLEGRTFASLDEMMLEHAAEATRLAHTEYGMELDYSPESIAQLETVLAARSPVPDADLEQETKLWGSYLGEVFRRRYGAEWVMALYPDPARREKGGELSMPALGISGSQLYPLLKIQRRLTMGPSEDVVGFFKKVSAALDARSS